VLDLKILYGAQVVIIEYLQHKKDIDTKRNEKKSHQILIRIPFFFFLIFKICFLFSIYIFFKDSG
jgi:hypothetical protein